VWESHCSLSICVILFRVRACLAYSKTVTNQRRVENSAFEDHSRGNFSVDIKMNNFVGNILQNKFYACCYILLYQVRVLNTDAHLSAAAVLLCYFRCHWYRNLSEVNCILHWIVCTLSTLQMGITLVIVVA